MGFPAVHEHHIPLSQVVDVIPVLHGHDSVVDAEYQNGRIVVPFGGVIPIAEIVAALGNIEIPVPWWRAGE